MDAALSVMMSEVYSFSLLQEYYHDAGAAPMYEDLENPSTQDPDDLQDGGTSCIKEDDSKTLQEDSHEAEAHDSSHDIHYVLDGNSPVHISPWICGTIYSDAAKLYTYNVQIKYGGSTVKSF